jgi:hypothetical protein
MHAGEGLSSGAELTYARATLEREVVMNRKLQPLTETQKRVLKKILPKSVERFTHDREDHVTDAKTFFEVWLEMPGMRAQYASLGFTPDSGPLYWTAPPVPQTKIEGYKAKGYGDEYKKFLWRYVEIPDEFWKKQEAWQIAWLVQRIENLLKEDEQLRGM